MVWWALNHINFKSSAAQLLARATDRLIGSGQTANVLCLGYRKVVACSVLLCTPACICRLQPSFLQVNLTCLRYICYA